MAGMPLLHTRTPHDAARVDPYADLDAAPRRGVHYPGRGVQHALGELEELYRVLVALHQQPGGRLRAPGSWWGTTVML